MLLPDGIDLQARQYLIDVALDIEEVGRLNITQRVGRVHQPLAGNAVHLSPLQRLDAGISRRAGGLLSAKLGAVLLLPAARRLLIVSRGCGCIRWGSRSILERINSIVIIG